MRLIGLVILALSLMLAPHAVGAQQTGKVYRVGILSGGSPEKNAPQIETFLKALHEMGWIDGPKRHHRVAICGGADGSAWCPSR
jgi:hypothetical protein